MTSPSAGATGREEGTAADDETPTLCLPDTALRTIYTLLPAAPLADLIHAARSRRVPMPPAQFYEIQHVLERADGGPLVARMNAVYAALECVRELDRIWDRDEAPLVHLTVTSPPRRRRPQ